MEKTLTTELQYETKQSGDVAREAMVAELGAAQLVLVGGGCGDVLWG
jgi:hypothetical protein